MLDALRSQASSWVVKILLGILVLSFALWGIGDIFLRPRGAGVAATVDGREITVAELARQFEISLRELSDRLGSPIDRTHPLAASALNDALQTLIARRLVEAYADDLGIGVSDEEVAQAIREDPRFGSKNGIDRTRLELYLRSRGISEAAFVEQVRADLIRNRLLVSLATPVRGSRFLARLLYDYRNESRTGEALFVDSSAQKVEEPDDEVLRGYLKEHAEAFQRPEFRSVKLVVLRAEDLVDEISVDEEELRRLYEARKDMFREPERRRIVQLLVPDEETARQAREMLAQGRSMDEVAEALKEKGAELSTLGPVPRDQLPPKLAEVAFSLKKGEISDPVQTPFGWHILQVAEIEPEHVASFEEKREELERELKLQKASEQLPDLAASLDDELAAGSTLDEAAQHLGVPLIVIEAMDARGRDPEGKPVAEGKLTSDMIQAIFSAPEGEPSLVEETSDGRYYAFEVLHVEKSRPYRLEEARDHVLAAWRREQQLKAAKALATRLLEEAKKGASFADLASRYPSVRLETVGPVKRTDDGARLGLTPDAIRALFRAEEGSLVDQVFEVPKGAAILRLVKIEPAPEPEGLAGIVGEIRVAWQSDIFAQLEAALRERYPIEVNERVVAGLLKSGS